MELESAGIRQLSHELNQIADELIAITNSYHRDSYYFPIDAMSFEQALVYRSQFEAADLSNKCTIVTGGARGLGLGAVRKFAENGSTVAIADLSGERLQESVSALIAEGYAGFEAPCDLRDGNSARQMVCDAAERMGRLDYLVNIAGHPVTLAPIPADDIDSQTEELCAEMFSVNLLSAFRTAHAAAPYLKKSHGAIVNSSSMAGWRIEFALQRRQGWRNYAHERVGSGPGSRSASERHFSKLCLP